MKYNGKFKFNNKWHPGTLEVDDNNKITLTINENFIKDNINRAVGNIGIKTVIVNNCFMIDYGRGFCKYLVDTCSIFNHIVSNTSTTNEFRFTFEPLREWIAINTIRKKENQINIIIPEDIVLYNERGIEIRISFYKEEDEIDSASINSLRIQPYIKVKTEKKLKISQVINYIQIITRFFAMLIGYTDNVRVIHSKYTLRHLKPELTFEKNLIININFSNRVSTKQAYYIYRSDYLELSNDISILFKRWFTSYEKYKKAIMRYFSPSGSLLLEDNFLYIVRALESLSYANEEKRKIKKQNRQFNKIIDDFYEKYKPRLEEKLTKSKFSKNYIKNIDAIHKEIAASIVYNYTNRVDLSERIRKIDKNGLLTSIYSSKHITQKSDCSVYKVIANTRNYYTHMGEEKNCLKLKYIPMYTRYLEQLLVRELLKIVFQDESYIDKMISSDNYLTCYKKIKEDSD